jgi:dipeptidyl aminopeptidase/acylaminoacyl peptidase
MTEDLGREDAVTALYDSCRIVAVNPDGSKPVVLLRNELVLSACSIVSLKGPEPGTILMEIPDGGSNSPGASRFDNRPRRLKVFGVDVTSGSRKRSVEGTSYETIDWIADASGRVRIRVDAVGNQQAVFARIGASDDWVEVYRTRLFAFEPDKAPNAKNEDLNFLGFGVEPDQVYVSYWPGDRETIGIFDLRTKSVSEAVADPKFDVGSPLRLRNGRIVGAWIERATTDQFYFGSDWRQLQQVLRESYPGHHTQIVSSSDDLSRHIIYVEGPSAPAGAYQVLDLKASSAVAIGSPYPKIPAGSVGEQKFVSYVARDGLTIDAYLTMPPGGAKANLPAIVFPHGGPAARDTGGFDWMSQFFASRGYVVLQPQYRGSTGFGASFARAGEKQWGLKMQDDVSDGVKYLVASGVADPKRICIAGWSYGGYAAMAGATLTPELYRCSIAGAGVSDLIEMLESEAKSSGWKDASARYWRNHIGSVSKESQKLAAASPARLVARVVAPMLLIHGVIDTIVPIEQSRLMARALKAANKPFELVELEGEGHHMSFATTRIKTLSAMEKFLLQHNPPN